MKVVVTSEGTDLDSDASLVFGRCPVYIFVDTETMGFEAVTNPAQSAPGGAGIKAAQFVVRQGAQAVLTGNVGPNAYNVLEAASVPMFTHEGGTVRHVVEAYNSGQLKSSAGASARAHAGMGMRRVRPDLGSQPMSGPAREHEVETLQKEAVELRQRLADIVDRLGRLEKES
jgi:predicted Fe-Mo cluster-binding NifX family protein